MNLLEIVRIVCLVCTGMLAGIYFGDRMGYTYARTKLDASSFVQCQQIIHEHFVKFMPFMAIAAVLGNLAWIFLVRAQWENVGFWLIALATCGILLTAVLTRKVNVPLNDQLMTWSIADPPPNLSELWAPWETVHTIRTFLATVAFICQAIALNLQ
jgi:uncharacterized membrane protein